MFPINRRTFVGSSLASVSIAGLLRTSQSSYAAEGDLEVVQTSVKLKTPKSGRDKRQGKMLDSITASIYIPQDLKVVRGALFNPFYEDTVKQSHWRAACQLWGFALVGTNLFGVRKDEQGETTTNIMQALAKDTKHSELENVPLCFHGMSIGGGLSAQLSSYLPDRTLASAPVCLEVGPQDKGSRKVPMITIFGERDGRQMEKLLGKLPEQRSEGARWAIATQWRLKHEWARANNLILPLYDQMITARYPQDANPLHGPIKLKDLPEDKGWIGDHTSWQQPVANISAGSDAKLCWLPNHYLAACWQSFVAYQPKLKIVSPTGMGDGAKFQNYPAGQAIEVSVKLEPDLQANKIEIFNGDQLLAVLKDGKTTGEIKTPSRGILALRAVATFADSTQAVSPLNTLVVL